MKFKCIEYKKDGNSTKVVQRDLLPVYGCNSLYYLLDGKYYARVYKVAKGYAVYIGGLHPERLTEPGTKCKMNEINGLSVSELISSKGLFPGRAVLDFLRLSGNSQELSGAIDMRHQIETAREEEKRQREAEEERRRAEQERAERERIEQLQMDATEVFMKGAGGVSSEALELLAGHCGISIHPRTLGVLRGSVKFVYIEGDKYKLQATKGTKKSANFSGIFSLMADIHSCIDDARKFLDGENICA